MTLDIASYGKDFIVAGTDSRGTFGDFRIVTATLDMMKKGYIIADHVAVLISGTAEVGSELVEQYIEAPREIRIDGITNVVRSFRDFVATRCNQYFANVPFEHRPNIVFIVAGLDESEEVYNSPKIYTMMSQLGFAPGVHRYGFACAGIPVYATYFFNRNYRRDMDINELSGLVAYAIQETATQDQRVGGPITLMQITSAGCRELRDEEVQEILEAYPLNIRTEET